MSRRLLSTQSTPAPNPIRSEVSPKSQFQSNTLHLQRLDSYNLIFRVWRPEEWDSIVKNARPDLPLSAFAHLHAPASAAFSFPGKIRQKEQHVYDPALSDAITQTFHPPPHRVDHETTFSSSSLWVDGPDGLAELFMGGCMLGVFWMDNWRFDMNEVVWYNHGVMERYTLQ